MALSLEQFNKIATKEELSEVKDDVKEIKQNVKQILKTVDGISQGYKKAEEEQTSNLGAHARIQKDVNDVREHAGLDIKNPVLDNI